MYQSFKYYGPLNSTRNKDLCSLPDESTYSKNVHIEDLQVDSELWRSSNRSQC
jgi:hypothetical protein